MGFLSGLVLGASLGLTLLVAFVHFENRRSLRRQQLGVFIAGLSRLTPDDIRRIFWKETVPPWIVFPAWEKIEWLNQELKRTWPFIDKAASLLLQTLLEPILEQYKPAAFASLNFQKFTLGTVTPQITGIRMVEREKEEIVMEMEVKWDGNPIVILAVQPISGVSLPVQVKDAAFTGIFQLTFKPLVNDIPGFGAVLFSLKELKNLDFKLKVVGGNVTAFPGVETIIEGMIRTAVIDSLLWPNRIIIPIIPGDYRDLQLRAVGILEVKVVQAKNLKNMDIIGKSDPFAQIYIRPIPSRMKKTKTINNDLNPVWNEHFNLEVEDVYSQKLTVKVFDDEGLQASQLIGSAEAELRTLEAGALTDLWLEITQQSNDGSTENMGEVHVELVYHPFDEEVKYTVSAFKTAIPSFPLTLLEKEITSNVNGFSQSHFNSLVKEGTIIRGILSVTVIRAENLPTSDLSNRSDPYVELKMKKSDVQKTTKVIPNCVNPEWNQNFDIMVEDAIHDMLLLEVFDHNTFIERSLGKCAVTLSRVLQEGDYTTEIKLLGVNTGVIFLRLKWVQPIPPDLQFISTN